MGFMEGLQSKVKGIWQKDSIFKYVDLELLLRWLLLGCVRVFMIVFSVLIDRDF